MVLDITEAVKHWQNDQETTQGLHVEFLEKGTNTQIDPGLLGFNDTGSNSLSESFIVVFFKNHNNYNFQQNQKANYVEEIDQDLESIGMMLEDNIEEHPR